MSEVYKKEKEKKETNPLPAPSQTFVPGHRQLRSAQTKTTHLFNTLNIVSCEYIDTVSSEVSFCVAVRHFDLTSEYSQMIAVGMHFTKLLSKLPNI
jgi:hypothetical protein